MPNAISLATLNSLSDQLASGDVAGVYNYLKSQGYSYANLALGVDLNNTVSGSTAIEFLSLSGTQTGHPVDSTEMASIKLDLAKAYVNALIVQAQNQLSNGVATKDLNSEQACNIHNQVFESHNLSHDVWTLDTPFALLNDVDREALWQQILQSDGSVVGDAKAAFSLFEAVTKANIAYVQAGKFDKVEEIANWAMRIEAPATVGAAVGTALKLLLDSVTGALVHYDINFGDISNQQEFKNATSEAIAKTVFPDLPVAGVSDGTAEQQAANQYALKVALEVFFGSQVDEVSIVSNTGGAIISGDGKQVVVTTEGVQVTVTDPSGNVRTSVYDTHGSLTSQVTVTANGVSEKVIVNGQVTQQNDYSNDLTSVIHTINGDKTQSAMVYDATGTAISNTFFDVSGNKTTAYIFRSDGSTSRQYDFGLDGSILQHDFNLDGSQSLALFGPNGIISEYAAYDASGFLIQDVFYANGQKTQQYDFRPDHSYVEYEFHTDGTQVAGVFDPNGQMIEYATFAANGFKTHDLFFSNGIETTRYDYVQGGNTTKYEFHLDGTQNVSLFGPNGQLTEYATFAANGFKTQDLFFSNGTETTRYDYVQGGNTTKYDFYVDGTQNVSLFGPNGQLTEYATFAANGFKTQDLYFSNGIETTRYDYVQGGNTTKYDFHVDGTQNVSLFGPNGQLTEYATFAANGFKTQDLFFTNGTETTRYDYVQGGNTTKYDFHVDGTQNVSLYGPNGQIIEYATFAANGFKTQDQFFTNGHLTQENDFKSNGSIIVHMINGDNSQTATLYGANGMQQELAKYDSSGRLYQDFQWDSSGHITQQINFNADGGRTVYQFHADNSYDAYLFNSALQETEFDSFNALGNLTGFYKYSYNNDGSYWSTQYDATGHAIGKSEYSSSGQWLQNGGIYIPGNGGSFPIGNLMFSGQI
ncbi:hypothetical protein [Paraburkholderia sp. BR13444]|uniref:hypothetical protein n=1 Tax=Paraburkholderia sp. BR13444 TaxID=3236997 RepID=UPI0034CD5AEE